MKKIQKESIEHYDRMIEWVKMQDESGTVDWNLMSVSIKENWFANSCSYCVKHFPECGMCELEGDSGCCDDLWWKMSHSDTWKQWLYWAYRVRAYIKRMG